MPAEFKTYFRVDFLENTWKHEGKELFRAEKLYTARNYQAFLKAFKENFPHYVHYCPFRQKEVISAPLSHISKLYAPDECLRRLFTVEERDSLQETTLDLLNLLSNESGIAMGDFGVHGSIALSMHTPKSDIDLVVYGAQNFRKLESTIQALVREGKLFFTVQNRLDSARRHRGRYLNKPFMYNAIRKPEEIRTKYGGFRYKPISKVRFQCKISDDSEAMFRPAIYKIEDYAPTDSASRLSCDQIPELVVSMIGCYRNVARQAQKIEVSGMLEQVEDVTGQRVFHQVVVGTGVGEDEHVCPL